MLLKGVKASWIPWALKTGLGYVGRGAFVFMVVIPVIASIAKNIGYAIFGKPTKTIAREKAKEEAEKLAAQQEQQNIQQTQTQQPAATQQQTSQPAQQPAQQAVQQPQQSAKPGNLLDKMKQNQANPVASQTLQPIASTTIKKTPEEDAGIKRSYVPNAYLGTENPVNPASSRSAQIDEVLRRADIAEARARALGA